MASPLIFSTKTFVMQFLQSTLYQFQIKSFICLRRLDFNLDLKLE
jgi:hypothetical protein